MTIFSIKDSNTIKMLTLFSCRKFSQKFLQFNSNIPKMFRQFIKFFEFLQAKCFHTPAHFHFFPIETINFINYKKTDNLQSIQLLKLQQLTC